MRGTTLSVENKKAKNLEQFHADLIELASRADCGDREDEWVRDMFTAQTNKEKIAEELLAQTRSPQDAYEYAIRLAKGRDHGRTKKTNPFGIQTTTTKQEPVHYLNTRGRYNQQKKREALAVLAADRTHVELKTQWDNNNGTQTQDIVIST